jgi:S-DNA-T family DNA segregation ATPase FtsK/SpoIIIE
MPGCAECGHQPESLSRAQILAVVPELAGEHARLLTSASPENLRARPRAGSWSALEYGCHVRDLLRVQRERILLAQAEDVPRFATMRREERVAEDRYNEQDPAAVAVELAAAAAAVTEVLAGLDDAGWLLTGVYNWPERAVRSVEWIARRTTHELAHHLFDERRLLSPTP